MKLLNLALIVIIGAVFSAITSILISPFYPWIGAVLLFGMFGFSIYTGWKFSFKSTAVTQWSYGFKGVEKFLLISSAFYLSLCAASCVILFVGKAYVDYGWLGAILGFSIAIPISFFLPLVAWFWLPASDLGMAMYSLLVLAAINVIPALLIMKFAKEKPLKIYKNTNSIVEEIEQINSLQPTLEQQLAEFQNKKKNGS